MSNETSGLPLRRLSKPFLSCLLASSDAYEPVQPTAPRCRETVQKTRTPPALCRPL
jgi:hypothetical protein